MPSPSVTPQVTGSASGTMAVKPQSEALICVTSLRRSCTLPRQRDRVTQAKLIQTAQVRDIERHSGNFWNAVDSLDYIRDRGSILEPNFCSYWVLSSKLLLSPPYPEPPQVTTFPSERIPAKAPLLAAMCCTFLGKKYGSLTAWNIGNPKYVGCRFVDNPQNKWRRVNETEC